MLLKPDSRKCSMKLGRKFLYRLDYQPRICARTDDGNHVEALGAVADLAAHEFHVLSAIKLANVRHCPYFVE
jgi:hypothetical protein